jgi:hypothetical protein
VRERLQYVFASFHRHLVVRRVVRDLKLEGLNLPVRVTSREGYGSLVWKTPSMSAVVRILHNPAYAGAYVFGKWDYGGDRRSAKTGKVLPRPLPMAQWPVKIDAHHPAYLSWEEYVKNNEQMRQNWHDGDETLGVAREGEALLQGMVYCGICGRKMGVHHHAGGEKRSSAYVCQSGYEDGDRLCQSMTSRPVDVAVAEAFLDSVSPLSLAIGLRVVEQLENDLAVQQRQRDLQLERARYEARLTQRQYDAVDPDNRLVASELERRWNEKLETVTRLAQAYQRAEEQSAWKITAEERESIEKLSRNLPALWKAQTTTNQDRKQLLRMAIESVQLDGVTAPGMIEIQIRWRSGTITRSSVKRPAPGEGSLKTPSNAVKRIHELVGHCSYADIARQLNSAGYRTAFGRHFNTQHVGYICRRDGLMRNK